MKKAPKIRIPHQLFRHMVLEMMIQGFPKEEVIKGFIGLALKVWGLQKTDEKEFESYIKELVEEIFSMREKKRKKSVH